MNKLKAAAVILAISVFAIPFAALGGGQVEWTPNGEPVDALLRTYESGLPAVISDGSGGVIIAWTVDGGDTLNRIAAQRLNENGSRQWSDAAVICAVSNGNGDVVSATDGSGGAIISWPDFRNGGADIYAQRVNGSGVVQWTEDGVVICDAADWQQTPRLVSDGSGGAIITWDDYRSGRDIYAQRVNGSGAGQWTANGLVICNATGTQAYPNLAGSGSGGAIIAWTDKRNDSSSFYADLYAQRAITSQQAPTITTQAVSNPGTTTATGNGNITQPWGAESHAARRLLEHDGHDDDWGQ